MRARKSRSLLDLASSSACARAAFAASGSREPSRFASRPSGFDPSRKGLQELLAGGTRERGSPAAIAITAPFPGAAIEPVSSLHSDPRAPSGRYAHALRVPFSVEAMRPWRTPGRACGPSVAQRNSHEHTMEGGLRRRFRILSGRGGESECRRGFAVTGYRLRERLAAPVAETRDVQTLSSGAHRRGPGKPL